MKALIEMEIMSSLMRSLPQSDFETLIIHRYLT